MGLRSVVLPVKSVGVSAGFYKTALGLVEDYAADGMIWLRIGHGERTIPLLLHPTEEPQPVTNGLAMEWAVDDVEVAVSSVQSAGGSIVQEPVDRDWGVREAVIEDPDGYRIWLVQPLA
jgi:predicted enzyme related to lactoylglutathione lyase